jgi:uncharacterized phage protein (TIGR02220 family)
MMNLTTSPKLKVTVQTDFDSVVKRLRQLLTADNFNILIDTSIQDLIGHKTDAPLRPHWIFGVYRADFLFRAFVITPESSVLMPQTFTVTQLADDLVEVSSLDPRFISDIIGSPYLKAATEDLYNNINRVMEAVKG